MHVIKRFISKTVPLRCSMEGERGFHTCLNIFIDAPLNKPKYVSLPKDFLDIYFSSVQSLSHIRLFVTPWTVACQAFLSITNSQSSLKLMSITSVQPSHPLSSPSPPAPNPSQHQGLFKWVSSSQQVAKVLEFQLQHQSFQWIFRTDFL